MGYYQIKGNQSGWNENTMLKKCLDKRTSPWEAGMNSSPEDERIGAES